MRSEPECLAEALDEMRPGPSDDIEWSKWQQDGDAWICTGEVSDGLDTIAIHCEVSLDGPTMATAYLYGCGSRLADTRLADVLEREARDHAEHYREQLLEGARGDSHA